MKTIETKMHKQANQSIDERLDIQFTLERINQQIQDLLKRQNSETDTHRKKEEYTSS